MYNAAYKPIALAMLASLMATGCTSAPSADELLSQATLAYESCNYPLVIELADSLSRTFPDDTGNGLAALNLRARAMEGTLMQQLATADSIIAIHQAHGDSLRAMLRLVENPVENYYIMGDAPRDLAGTTTLQARVTTDHKLYIISTCSKGAGHTSLTLSAGGETFSTPVIPHDNELNYTQASTEYIHFTGSPAEEMAQFISRHSDTPIELTYNGTGKAVPVKGLLAPGAARQIAAALDYVHTARELAMATLSQQRIDRQLATVRATIARTTIATPQE